ncbi:MAG: DUF4388 domain-containing protein [Candidatus Aminicenantes bacterium]|nr:DUF4388 domain-containing protein [Candidatus Aminicenantes bacterium]
MSLKGSLESVNLADVMQLVSNSRQSGRFVLTRGSGDSGYIIIKDGELVHAQVGNFMGEDALFTLIAWGKGEFVFEEGPFAEQTTITRSITSLLMESARRIDEWKLLRKKIGSIDAKPAFNDIDKAERRKISLSTLEWLVIAKIDGRATIDEISKASGINIYDTARIIFGMITSGLLRLT